MAYLNKHFYVNMKNQHFSLDLAVTWGFVLLKPNFVQQSACFIKCYNEQSFNLDFGGGSTTNQE